MAPLKPAVSSGASSAAGAVVSGAVVAGAAVSCVLASAAELLLLPAQPAMTAISSAAHSAIAKIFFFMFHFSFRLVFWDFGLRSYSTNPM